MGKERLSRAPWPPVARSDRGVGIKFGPDVTTKFCSQNRLRCATGHRSSRDRVRFMVRSHQVPEDGSRRLLCHDDLSLALGGLAAMTGV